VRIVLANGVFDLLHVGHICHLEEARSYGDVLVIGLTMDEFVGKPGRPIIPQDERREMLEALRCVSAVTYCKDSIQALRDWQPHVFAKGWDYTLKHLLPEEIAHCSENGIEIRHTKENTQTTSSIIERILRG